MNRFKLVVTVLLITVLVATTAFAAVGKGVVKQKAPAIGGITGSDEGVVSLRARTAAKKAEPFRGQLPAPSATAAGLSGTYRIGVAKDFPTIASALTSLAINGVAGPCTFYLTDATYTEGGLLLGAPAGVSSVNTILFKPDSTVATVATVTLTNSAANGGGWVLTGSKWVTIDGTKKNGAPLGRNLVLQFDPAQGFPASALNGVLRIRDGSHHITVKNSQVFSMYNGTNTSARPGIVLTNASGQPAQNSVTIDNNLITRASLGIATVGGDPFDSNLVVTNNQIGNTFGTAFAGQQNYIQREGIYSEWTTRALFSRNQISGVFRNISEGTSPIAGTSDAQRTIGIYALWTDNSQISYNVVDSVISDQGAAATSARNAGVRLQSLTPNQGFPGTSLNKVFNNAVTRVFGVGNISAGDIGIDNFPGYKDTLYNNSVYLTGVGASASRGCTGFQLSGDQTTGPDPLAGFGKFAVRNNAVRINRTTANAAAMRVFNTRGHDISSGDRNVYAATKTDVQTGANLYNWIILFSVDSNSTDGDPNFTSTGNLHLAAGASAANNLGLPVSVADDIDGDLRSATPDAGYDEAGVGTTSVTLDAKAISIDNLPASGIPFGLASIPKGTVKNNSLTGTAGFNVHIVIKNELLVTFLDETKPTGALGAFGSTQVTFSSFTPTTNGPYSIVMSADMAGDQNHANDTLTKSQVVTPKITVASLYSECFDGVVTGWNGTGDFVLGGPFTKLGGVFGGSGKTWVTKTAGHYTNSRTVSAVLSPFFDISAFTGDNVWVSFSHSLLLEPNWDRSIFQYTTDNVNWVTLGDTNTPDGVNWYNKAVYEHAFTDVDHFDSAGARLAGYPFTLGLSNPGWTSNGEDDVVDTATGPTGYVFSQLQIKGLTALQKSFIRFRYFTYADNSGNSGTVAGNTAALGDGWAWDCFRLANTATTFTSGSVAGTRYIDVNGNGANDAEAADVGKVYLAYFGVPRDSVTTNGSGGYSFTLTTPGTYQVSIVKPGFVITQPITSFYTISYAGDGSTSTGKDFGVYAGSISGQKYNDKNGNGIKDGGDVGLAGWRIELHKDSCNGATVQTAVTNASGNYSFNAAPRTYYLKEVAQPAAYRQTAPANNCITVTVAGASGTFNSLNNDFGNFKKGSIKLEKVVDLNGNGVKEGGDVTAMPVGATAKFYLKRGATTIDSVTLGNLVLNQTLVLDTGSYSFTEAVLTPGWVRTIPSGTPTQSFIVDTSAISLTISYANFKMVTFSGTKYDDKNGNGARDSGEGGLANWKINVKGGLFFGGTSATTDSAGNWSIDSVGGAKDTVTEVVQAGWTQTAPAGGQVIVNVGSGTNVSGLDFGNFKNDSLIGYKYRDRNANGSRQLGEEGLSGWQINLSGAGGGSTTSDATGKYAFANVGPGSHTLSETPQVGWAVTQPPGGTYTFSMTSGVNQSTGHDFGNFKTNDSTFLYRTFTSDEMEAAAQVKATKPNKPNKPFVAPNLQALLKDYYKQFGPTSEILVGVSGVLNQGGKLKAYVYPGKYTDVFKSIWDKGVVHSTDVDSTEVHRGLDVDNKSKQMLKRFKSLSPKKQKNDTFEELLVMSMNIALSDAGKTPVGLSTLIYDDGIGGALYNGMTIGQIMAAADNVMTNYEFVPLSTYARLDEVASKINDAFSCGGFDCETIAPFRFDTTSWLTSAKVIIRGLYPVSAIPYLKANPNAVPTTTPKVTPQVLPDVYALYQNYPNPFNPTTTIEFDLPSDAFVTLKIYNILGQEMGTLFDHEALDAGNQDVDFDASALPSGVYFYRLVAQSLNDEGVATGQIFTQSKKMMLIK